MTIRIAAIEVSHWHALNDAAYLRHLVAMPDAERSPSKTPTPASSRHERPRWARRPSQTTQRRIAAFDAGRALWASISCSLGLRHRDIRRRRRG
jgi:hypothetical protein